MSFEPRCMQALSLAQDTRLTRSQVRKDVDAGRLSLAQALEHPACATAYVVHVVAYQRRWGMLRAEKALRGICSCFQLAGELTARQRSLITDVAAGRLVFDPPTGEHVSPQEAAERRAHRRFVGGRGA